MLISNAMRFGTDIFGEQVVAQGGDSSAPSAVVVTKSARLEAKEPLDCTNVTSVTGITITGNEPAGSARRFMFRLDGKYYKFLNGQLSAQSSASLERVLKYGNTKAQLDALTDIPEFIGKQVYPVIALQAPVESDFPSAKLKLKTTTSSDTLTKTYWSAEYDLLGDNVKIVDINADTTCTGQGSVTVKCQLYHNNAWSSWLPLNEANNLPVEKIRFSFVAKVVNIGSDSAQVDSVTVRHTTGSGSVNGDLTEIFTPRFNFDVPLQAAYLVVQHKRLIDSAIEASVAFLPTPKHKERVSLGVATGSRESFSLPDSEIDHATLEVFVDGEPYSDFEFNLVVNEITLNAPRDSVVAASYDYDVGAEVWQPMTRTTPQQPYGKNGAYASRFAYAGNLDNCSCAAMRIRLVRPTGTVNYQLLGTATGYRQDYLLPHKMTSIVVSNTKDYSYDNDSQLLTLVAPANKVIGYAGKFIGEQHALYGFAAGFSL